MKLASQTWFRALTIALLLYTVLAGMLFDVPRLPILNESIRALYFHVPMWFGMVIILLLSVIHSIRYLSGFDIKNDVLATQYANVGILYGVLGLLTGMLWANYTWGTPWHGDPKQTTAAIAVLIYLAYSVLRGSIEDGDRKARIAAVYNIFAFAAMIPLLFILPRLTSSMHPGSGGNPGFNAYDLDSKMRMVFYPSVIAFTALGIWIASLYTRLQFARNSFEENNQQ